MFRQVLTSSTQPQIWSIHVVRMKTAKKCVRMQNARAGRAEPLSSFINPIVLWRSLPSLRKLSNLSHPFSKPEFESTVPVTSSKLLVF